MPVVRTLNFNEGRVLPRTTKSHVMDDKWIKKSRDPHICKMQNGF